MDGVEEGNEERYGKGHGRCAVLRKCFMEIKLSFPIFLAPSRVAKHSGGRSTETCQGVMAKISWL